MRQLRERSATLGFSLVNREIGEIFECAMSLLAVGVIRFDSQPS